MIEVAIQRGPAVYIYGGGNRLLFTKNGTLAGYTSSTVTVKQGCTLFTYNDKGIMISRR